MMKHVVLTGLLFFLLSSSSWAIDPGLFDGTLVEVTTNAPPAESRTNETNDTAEVEAPEETPEESENKDELDPATAEEKEPESMEEPEKDTEANASENEESMEKTETLPNTSPGEGERPPSENKPNSIPFTPQPKVPEEQDAVFPADI